MKQNFDHQYRRVLYQILDEGQERPNRTGIGTRAIPSACLTHDFKFGFPLLTLKKVPLRIVAVELEGFLHGITDKRWYQERNCNIWNQWCSPEKVPYGKDAESQAAMAAETELGPIYGSQWRSFGGGADQLQTILDRLKSDPSDRRMICSAWNPNQLHQMALPPCHYAWQVVVINNTLHLNWTQRSADWFLGVPFDMASYALLAMLLAIHGGFLLGTVTGFFGDTHLYENQIEGAWTLLRREIRQAPTVLIQRPCSFLDWTHDNLEVVGYHPHPAIKVQVAV